LFTAQQRQGGASYAHQTLVGNWSEDLESHEEKFKDYMRKKDENALKITGAADRLDLTFSAIERAPCPDGIIHYGAMIGLHSEHTGGSLCCDPDERSGVFACTSSAQASQLPTVRNTFRILQHEGQDDIIRYGEKIKLNTIPKFDQDLCLSSERLVPGFASPLTKNQMVVFSPYSTFNNVWEILCADSMRRYETQGMPVLVGERFILKHCFTNVFLAGMPNTYPNEFGNEHEVCCLTFKNKGKNGPIAAEFAGKAGPTVLAPTCVDNNVWVFHN